MRLEPADPIKAGGKCQIWICLEVLLEFGLIELRVIERGELAGQASQHPDQTQLAGDQVDDDTEPQLPGKIEPIHSLPLHLAQGFAGSERNGDQIVPAMARIDEVADPARRLQGTLDVSATGSDVPHPGIDVP